MSMESIEKIIKDREEAAFARGRQSVIDALQPILGKPKREKPKEGRPKREKPNGAKRKNPWAGLSDEERLVRINAIRSGRGLSLKTSL